MKHYTRALKRGACSGIRIQLPVKYSVESLRQRRKRSAIVHLIVSLLGEDDRPTDRAQ